MRALNMQVDIEGKDAKDVAHQFLEKWDPFPLKRPLDIQ